MVEQFDRYGNPARSEPDDVLTAAVRGASEQIAVVPGLAATEFAVPSEDSGALLPAGLRERRGLPSIGDALREMHFPSSMDSRGAARRRLVYEELFILQIGLALLRARAKREPGRVFEITPEVGQVTVYFMRDEDDSGAIPDGTEVAEVKAALDLIRPANTAPVDLIVLAPIPVAVDFSFASVTPNSSSLKTAIKANLAQFFKEETSVAVNVLADAYSSVIFNTVDTTNGDTVTSFVLTEPVGDVDITTGEIAILGNISI